MVDQEWLITAAGVKMPRLIYGTAWKKERTADLVVKAIQSGFKGIDTACQPKHYDERLVGAALRRLKDQGVERDNLFLQTKFTALADQDPRQVPYDKNSPIESQVIQSFEASKNNLQNTISRFSCASFTIGTARTFDAGVGCNGNNSKDWWSSSAGNQQLLQH